MIPVVAKIVGVGITSTLGRGCKANIGALHGGEAQFQSRKLSIFNDPIDAAYLPVAPATNPPKTLESASSALEHMFDVLDSAVQEALQQADMVADKYREMPVFIGSTSYGVGLAEELYRQGLDHKRATAIAVPLDGFSQISERLREKFGLMGPDFSFNTACTSSANAILSAAKSIRSGSSEYALVIGIELCNITTLSGFVSMQLLASEVMRPFDRNRAGMVLGEGCGVLVLKAAQADCKGVVVEGGASRCDTYSIGNANPNGLSIKNVMAAALNDAGVKPECVVAIKAHGSASALSDSVEISGMRQLFSATPASVVPPFFSLKSYVGHTLGGCGAIEAALTTCALTAGFLPASAGFNQMDPELGLAPMTENKSVNGGYYLFNYFGFGGNNNSLVFSLR